MISPYLRNPDYKRVYSFQPFVLFSETSYLFDDPGDLF